MKYKSLAQFLLSLSLSLSLAFFLALGLAACAADSTSFNPGSVSLKASAAAGGVPVGTVVAWPVATNPSDAASWLECNGQATTGYPELAAVVGVRVPDLRGKFLRGFGGNSARLGESQGDAIRNIKASIKLMFPGGYTPNINHSALYGSGSYYAVASNVEAGSYFSLNFDASRAVPTANENRPLNMAVRYLIRARP